MAALEMLARAISSGTREEVAAARHETAASLERLADIAPGELGDRAEVWRARCKAVRTLRGSEVEGWVGWIKSNG
jgi:hypothetical protein